MNLATPLSSSIATPQGCMATPAQRTWIELSKSAFEHNIALYKRILGPDVKLAVVVKSNAYGHGLFEIAQLCEANNAIDWLCITSLSEALQLRKYGITKPLLVLCILDDSLAQAIENNIDIVVYDLTTVNMLNAIGASVQKKAYVHIKIDTGLSRFGFIAHEALAYIQAIARMPWISIRGICSHFSQADHEDQSFTQEQLQKFLSLLEELANNSITIPLQHIGNTAASTSLIPSQKTFVRIGAGAYGLQPSAFTIKKAQEQHHPFILKPVMSWKTTIMHIRTVPANTPVGYGRSFITKQASTLAIIPVGYYEGYDRRFGNKGTVWITTQQGLFSAPIIGRICMNVSMIDISHIPSARVGDEVTLLGSHPHITAHELAHTIEGFNPREITTRINPIVQRLVIP